MRGFDLESLRKVFEDKRSHIAIGKITQLSMADDRSFLKCLVAIWPEEKEIVTRMSWDFVGPEAGNFMLPSVNDLVLVAFADGDEEHAFVIRRLTSVEDKIPLRAAEGHSIVKALPGKKVWITSDTRINLSESDTEPTEPLPLGNVLKALLSSILSELASLSAALASHQHVSAAPGYLSVVPQNASTFTDHATAFNSLKSSPVDDNLMNSDLSFTEKGG